MPTTTTTEQTRLIINVAAIKKGASVYRALYHPLRQKMMETIHKAGRLNVTPIIKKFKLEQSLISAQLKILRDANVLTTEREGKQIFYSVNYYQLNRISELTGKLISGQPFLHKKTMSIPMAKSKVPRKPILFTPTELKVIRLVCEQNTSDEIGKELGLSKRTIEDYRASVLKKMKVRNSVGILIYAVKNGLFKI